MTEKIVNTTAMEQTLKLVAELPAPEGLAERVKARLAAVEADPQRGRLLDWPAPSRTRTRWLPGAMAAGLLAAVAIGGTLAYRWVVPAPVARTAPAAARPAVPQQSFSSAGAMRTPVTLNGPAALPDPAQPHAAMHSAKKPNALRATPSSSQVR